MFLSCGVYAAEYSNISRFSPLSPVAGVHRSIDENIRPLAEMLEAYELLDLNLVDMERMDYGFRVETTVRPKSHYPNFGSEPTFQGNIWFLTSPLRTPPEAGTIPHIFNHEDMDALETVLALIAAGEY